MYYKYWKIKNITKPLENDFIYDRSKNYDIYIVTFESFI